jgi:hypothetical protein
MVNDKDLQKQNDRGSQQDSDGATEPISLNEESGNQLTEEDAVAEQQRKEAMTERD